MTPPITQWIIDTRPLWPLATQPSHLPHQAPRALSLLPSSQQQQVLRYIHIRDAKMCLASHLLKRYLICSQGLVSSWWDAIPGITTKDNNGNGTKPGFALPDGSEPLCFNVSHQNGIVVIVAGWGVSVGVDVVCPGERRGRDHAMMLMRDSTTAAGAAGWCSFVDMHAEVLSPKEVTILKNLEGDDLDTRLRKFYALWCLREAYVKMTGEALLAPWLGDLEMRNFAPPASLSSSSLGGKEEGGESQTKVEVWREGERVQDVDIYLVDILEGEYMICTSVERDDKGAKVEVKEFEFLNVEEVIRFGEGMIGGVNM